MSIDFQKATLHCLQQNVRIQLIQKYFPDEWDNPKSNLHDLYLQALNKELEYRPPNRRLISLKRYGGFSNQISQNAVNNAVAIWQCYLEKPNHLRHVSELQQMLNELQLVATQISANQTRIAPLQYLNFLVIFAMLKTAIDNNLVLEPMPNAVNDDKFYPVQQAG
nr:hypothetical protein [uncultured Moraxella sp.]